MAGSKGRITERLRGRAGQAQRQRRLKRSNYLCEHCLDKKITRLATIVDHKVPLAFGGSDDDENTQNLCDECNADKTAMDAASQQGASNHPDWLKPSAIPLTIVSGPPCSGKTTMVRDKASPDDVVIDLDGIMTRLQPNYQHWSGSLDPSLMNRAIRVRNEMLGSLSRRKHGRAWFIVSAPAKAERDWWHSKLGGTVELLHPGVEECKRRAIARGTPNAITGIEAWERKARETWQPPQSRKPKQRIGTDGWPTT